MADGCAAAAEPSDGVFELDTGFKSEKTSCPDIFCFDSFVAEQAVEKKNARTCVVAQRDKI